MTTNKEATPTVNKLFCQMQIIEPHFQVPQGEAPRTNRDQEFSEGWPINSWWKNNTKQERIPRKHNPHQPMWPLLIVSKGRLRNQHVGRIMNSPIGRRGPRIIHRDNSPREHAPISPSAQPWSIRPSNLPGTSFSYTWRERTGGIVGSTRIVAAL